MSPCRSTQARSPYSIVACWCAFVLLFAPPALAATGEVIPPKPDSYFNDYAHVTSPATAQRLNEELKQFEHDTSDQIVVAIYPKMESESSIEDYTVRVAQAWGVGQKERKNGAVLFVFIQDRKMYLQVGYGLEGALPDATAKQIIDQEIRPRFRNGDYDGGLTAAVNAILAATRGEYKGTGRTVQETKQGQAAGAGIVILFLFVGLILLLLLRRALRGPGGMVYGRRGYSSWGGWTMGGGGWSSVGWGGGGGWSGGGGGGGFSSGGGSFGGGGAGGSW